MGRYTANTTSVDVITNSPSHRGDPRPLLCWPIRTTDALLGLNSLSSALLHSSRLMSGHAALCTLPLFRFTWWRYRRLTQHYPQTSGGSYIQQPTCMHRQEVTQASGWIFQFQKTACSSHQEPRSLNYACACDEGVPQGSLPERMSSN